MTGSYENERGDKIKKDKRYDEYVARQKRLAESRKSQTRKYLVAPAANPERSIAAASTIKRQATVFPLFILVLGAITAGVYYLATPQLAVRPFQPDPFQVEYALNAGVPLEITNSVGMRLRLIPHGTYKQGSPLDEPGHTKFEYAHEITIPRPFYMAVTETTQQEYLRVMRTNPSMKDISGDAPVEYVTWEQAILFCNQLSRNEGLREVYEKEGKQWRCFIERDGYRLPVEAEWERACRAGTTGAIYVDAVAEGETYEDRIARTAWYRDSSSGHLHVVGQLEANPWGLYDMLGNVWEWCWDWFDEYPVLRAVELMGPERGEELKTIRGGGWYSDLFDCRSAKRREWNKDLPWNSLGFRCVRTAIVDGMELPEVNAADPDKKAEEIKQLYSPVF